MQFCPIIHTFALTNQFRLRFKKMTSQILLVAAFCTLSFSCTVFAFPEGQPSKQNLPEQDIPEHITRELILPENVIPPNDFSFHPRSSIANFQSKATLEEYRLPLEVKPISYEITLHPDYSTFLFDGKVVIKVKAQKQGQRITLHSLNQNILYVVVKDDAGASLTTTFRLDEEKQFLIISTTQYLIENSEYAIDITYQGYLNDRNEGFYKASYLDESGIEKWLGTTQFESTDARQAFPCFDEPALKAKFKLNMMRDTTYNSIFNTKQQLSTPKNLTNGVKAVTMDTFVETPQVVSTYLVAFVNSDFKKVSSSDGIHEVYATPAHIDDGRAAYALSISEPTMKAMEDFTGIVNYDMEKMTQIAIPDDWFASGAMENWGLVTYK